MPASLEQYRQACTDTLRSLLQDFRLPLYDMMRYHLGWLDSSGAPAAAYAGKALRPALCLMACDALCGSYRPALPAAAAIELLHNYSLVHDDVQDGDRERRGRPTVWSLWGKAQAINVGTAMRILANLALHRLELPPAKLLRIQDCLDRATLRLIEGQYLDISFEQRAAVAADEYLQMIRGKTAALIAASLQVGALIGCDDPQMARRFHELGLALGMAFQIRDDILGIWGDSAATGKPTGSDLVRRKKTYPIVCAWEKADRRKAERLRRMFRRARPRETGHLAAILEELGCRAAAQELVERYSAEALEKLKDFGFPPEVFSRFASMISALRSRSA
jgi:geranylgeranyl diphosphate synthase type I